MKSITLTIDLFNKIMNVLTQKPWAEVDVLMNEVKQAINDNEKAFLEAKDKAEAESKKAAK